MTKKYSLAGHATRCSAITEDHMSAADNIGSHWT